MAAVKRHSLTELIGEPLAPGLRIGLLGGSFNPAHEGHLHITEEAIARLELDQVWWLVSPQNPLKPADQMALFDKRFASAKAMATNPAIRVSDIEAKLGTQYTAETLKQLFALGPELKFVWLMGADNLDQLPNWKDWEWIVTNIPIAVMARPGFEQAENLSEAAKRFEKHRILQRDAKQLVDQAPPSWVFLPITPHPASATQIREQGKWTGDET